MSQLAADSFDSLVAKVRRLGKKPPDWRDRLMNKDKRWAGVAKAAIKVMDEMKGHGEGRPLASLQDHAFHAALESDDPAVKTAAFWLTDTRLRVEMFSAGMEKEFHRKRLVERGLMK